MSKVVLFSTRTIGENTLFGAGCRQCIHSSENSPIFKYFTGDGASNDEKIELGKNFPPSSCFDEIKKYCSQKSVWTDDYEKMEEEDVLADLSNNEEIKNNEEFISLISKYYDSNGCQVAIAFNLDSLKKYLENVSNNKPLPLALNIDNPYTDVTLDVRFSIYIKPQADENPEYVFMSIWPLGRTETKVENNGYNVWISTLVQQICNIDQNCEEITLLLHDKDISDSQPFKVIIPQKEYTVDSNRNVNLSVAIFQHTPDDPINDILIKPETNLSSVYDSISTILTKKCDMTKAGNAHTTRQVYQNLVNALGNENQAK